MRQVPLCLVALLAACATPGSLTPPQQTPPQPATLVVPAQLHVCPEATPFPPPPPPPRTLEQLVKWAVDVNATLIRTERARAECARELAKLNAWVESNLLKR